MNHSDLQPLECISAPSEKEIHISHLAEHQGRNSPDRYEVAQVLLPVGFSLQDPKSWWWMGASLGRSYLEKLSLGYERDCQTSLWL